MTRLTHRDYKNTTLPLDSCKPYLKLGQLEDIEEELGIDLITLFKAIKNGFYIKYWGDLRYCQLNEIGIVIDFDDKQFTDYVVNDYHFEDYGKTWALTKEELENENNFDGGRNRK